MRHMTIVEGKTAANYQSLVGKIKAQFNYHKTSFVLTSDHFIAVTLQFVISQNGNSLAFETLFKDQNSCLIFT